MNHSFNALLKVHSIKSRSFSLIRLCGNLVYRVNTDEMVSYFSSALKQAALLRNSQTPVKQKDANVRSGMIGIVIHYTEKLSMLADYKAMTLII